MDFRVSSSQFQLPGIPGLSPALKLSKPSWPVCAPRVPVALRANYMALTWDGQNAAHGLDV